MGGGFLLGGGCKLQCMTIVAYLIAMLFLQDDLRLDSTRSTGIEIR